LIKVTAGLEDTTPREASRSARLTKHYSSDQAKANEIGGARGTYGWEEWCIHGIGGETWGKDTTWNAQAYMGE